MVLVCGNSGFIGQHLLREIPNSVGISLRDKNWQDNFIDASVVINLVGKAHDHKGTASSEDFYYANVELTKKIFEKFVKSPAHTLIHISSIAAIEEIESEKPLSELDVPNPTSAYGMSKRAAEEWLLQQTLTDSKKLIILRPPMIHGPGDKGNLGLLFKLMNKGIPYPFAEIKNQRSFLSINNFIFYIKDILLKTHSIENGVYHISDDASVSTDEILAVISRVTKKKVRRIYLPNLVVKAAIGLGDYLSFPISSKKVRKLTSTLLVTNKKMNSALNIESLPESALKGIESTISSFIGKQNDC